MMCVGLGELRGMVGVPPSDNHLLQIATLMIDRCRVYELHPQTLRTQCHQVGAVFTEASTDMLKIKRSRPEAGHSRTEVHATSLLATF